MSEENKQGLKKNIKKIIVKLKNKHKKFLSFFSLHAIKPHKKFWFLEKNILLKINFVCTKNQPVLMKYILKE